MDPPLRAALEADRVVDITTRGRKSGEPRRIEIWIYHGRDGRLYLSGSPGTRSWYANISANPELTLHVKRGANVDLPMRGRPITNEAERRDVLAHILPEGRNLDEWLAGAPLVELSEV